MERTDKGFLMVPRAFFDSKIWQAARAFSECEAWLNLLQSARFEASPTASRIGSYEVIWGPGQYPASIRFLARKWGRSPQWVRTFLGKMRRAGWISTDDSQGVCVITVAGRGKDDTPANTPINTPVNTPNGLDDSELQKLATHPSTHPSTHPHTPNGLDDSELQRLATHLASLIAEKVAGNGAEKQHTSNTNNKKEEEMFLENPLKGAKRRRRAPTRPHRGSPRSRNG